MHSPAILKLVNVCQQNLQRVKSERSLTLSKKPSLFWKAAGSDEKAPKIQTMEEIKGGGMVLLQLRDAQSELKIHDRIVSTLIPVGALDTVHLFYW